ncbi:G2/M phase-specific E3 ubiquitin-protein ligase-like [Rhopilema esculentum]|uniref:G2/M phase-specific E3 ubiquitin-protein ligase-like n=1 Tax=Rhopilema esculentum TaxID=499914 RepID=UPI0031D4CDE1
MSCAICLEKDLNDDVVGGFLKGPCCKDSFFHRDCLQKYALSSGYFFRCPTCNNEKEFLTEMKIYGIYIPERDALWEDGVTYADLLEVNRRCDSRHCYCPKGRQHFGQWGRWKLFRCEICGHSAIHKYCGDSLEMHMYPYKCDICLLVENKGKFGDMIESYTKKCFVRLTDIMTDKEKSEFRCEGTLVGGSNSFSNLFRSHSRKPREKSLNLLDAGNNLNFGKTVKRKSPKARRLKQTAELNKECDEMRSIFRESIDFHKGFEESANEARGSLGLYPNHNLNCKALSMSNNSRQAKYPRFQCEGLKENQPSDTVRLKCALHKYIEHRLSLV